MMQSPSPAFCDYGDDDQQFHQGERLVTRSADSHVREFLRAGSREQGCPRSEETFIVSFHLF